VSMTIGMFFSRANRKTFSSLRAIPSGLICMHKIAQAILMMCGKEIAKIAAHNGSIANDQPNRFNKSLHSTSINQIQELHYLQPS